MTLESLGFLGQAAITTLLLFICAATTSTLLGVLLALMLESRAFGTPARIYSWLLRGMPPLTVLFFVFLGLPALGLPVPPFAAAWIGMTAYSLAYVGEIIRSGMKSIPPGVHDAARALGLPHHRALQRIYLPQAFSVILPPYISQLTEICKDTSIASVVAVVEIMNAAKSISARTFDPIPAFAVAALFYATVIGVLLIVQEWAGRKSWRAGV